MIRVLTVVQRLSRSGGIPVAIRTLLKHSDRALIQHYVCQLRPLDGDEIDDSTPSVAEIFSLDLNGEWIRSPGAIPAAFQLLNLIRSLRPDVVHLHTGTSLIAAPAKLFWGSRSVWLFDLHEPMHVRHSRLSSALVASMARHGSWCVSHSPPVTEEIIHSMNIPRNRVMTIPLGIDVDRFQSPVLGRGEWRASVGLSDQDILVLTVGKVSDTKGFWRLLEVAERLRSSGVRFAVVGRVKQPDMLTEEIRNRGLEDSVSLLGFVDDLPSALNAADMYFAPSSYEGFGISVVEAMAAGLPVVASAVGGLAYVVSDGRTGYLVDPEDTDGFRTAIELLAGNRLMRSQLGRLGQSRARENFDALQMAARYGEVYRQLVEWRETGPQGASLEAGSGFEP